MRPPPGGPIAQIYIMSSIFKKTFSFNSYQPVRNSNVGEKRNIAKGGKMQDGFTKDGL